MRLLFFVFFLGLCTTPKMGFSSEIQETVILPYSKPYNARVVALLVKTQRALPRTEEILHGLKKIVPTPITLPNERKLQKILNHVTTSHFLNETRLIGKVANKTWDLAALKDEISNACKSYRTYMSDLNQDNQILLHALLDHQENIILYHLLMLVTVHSPAKL